MKIIVNDQVIETREVLKVGNVWGPTIRLHNFIIAGFTIVMLDGIEYTIEKSNYVDVKNKRGSVNIYGENKSYELDYTQHKPILANEDLIRDINIIGDLNEFRDIIIEKIEEEPHNLPIFTIE